MCLSIPGKVIAKESKGIVVDYGTEKRLAELSLVDIELGDYVIISNKIIISKVEKKKAEQFLAMVNNYV